MRALVDLRWAEFLIEANSVDATGCTKIKLMDQKQGWDIADLLAEKFGYPMFVYYCRTCPPNPITDGWFWHVTKREQVRQRPVTSDPELSTKEK